MGAFAPNQPVLATIDARRGPRDAFYVETLDNGKITVRYDTRKGEQFATLAADRVAPVVDEQADDVPTVDVHADTAEATDDDLIAAARRAVELGEAVEVTDEYLAGMAAEIEAANLADAEAHDADTWDQGPLRPEVDTTDADAEVVAEPTTHTEDVRQAAAAAKPAKKHPLPEGYVTPVQLAKELNERGLYTGTSEKGLTSQQVYSYMKAAEGTDHAFPGVEHTDGRTIVPVEAGVAWWTAKNARAAARATGTGTSRPARRSTIGRNEVGQRLADILAETTGDAQAAALNVLAEELLA